jgi:hypothetical protein
MKKFKQTELMECLPSIGVESSVFQFAIPNYKEQIEPQFCLLFCMGVKLGLLHWGINIAWNVREYGDEVDNWVYEGPGSR